MRGTIWDVMGEPAPADGGTARAPQPNGFLIQKVRTPLGKPNWGIRTFMENHMTKSSDKPYFKNQYF